MRGGIIISEPNKDLSEGSLIYDSRRRKLNTDFRANPKHIDTFDLNGGTKFVTENGQTNRETLWSLEHKMPFKPFPLIYILTTDAPAAWNKALGRYTLNNAPMVVGAVSSTLGEELLYVTVDATHIKIIHKHNGPALGTGNATAYGSDFKFRVRYMITNQRSPFTSAEGAA